MGESAEEPLYFFFYFFLGGATVNQSSGLINIRLEFNPNAIMAAIFNLCSSRCVFCHLEMLRRNNTAMSTHKRGNCYVHAIKK